MMCMRREREYHTMLTLRGCAGAKGAGVRRAREWSAEILFVLLQELDFLLPFHILVSWPVGASVS